MDEANSAIGLARAACLLTETRGTLVQIQRDLYAIMAEIAATVENSERFRTIDVVTVGGA